MHEHIRRYLGELVISFSQLEGALCEGLAAMLPIDYDDAKVIFSSISFKKKTQILNALLRKYDKGYCNGRLIYELLSRANDIEDQRNTLVHSDWEVFFKPTNELKKNNYVLKRSKVKYNRKAQATNVFEEIGPNEIKKIKALIKNCENCSYEIGEEFGQIDCDIGSFRRKNV